MKFAKVKAATVAIAKVHKVDHTIFEIVGSGVCIDSKGVILTCEHVISAFMTVSISDQVKGMEQPAKPRALKAPPLIVPHAIFYKVDSDDRLLAFPCRLDQILASTVQDIGLIRVLAHTAFADGYPFVDLEEYTEVHEGLEVGTCGFPMGNS